MRGARRVKKIIKFILLILLCKFLLSSCASLMSDFSDSIYQQRDIQLLKDGAPSYLLLIEGMINSFPNNKKLLSFGIQLFSAYSSAFIEDNERQIIFTDKTKKWALMLLRTYPKFKKLENAEFDKYKEWTNNIKKTDVPYVFWATNAWIMWIISNSDSVDALMDLPKAKAIIDKIYEIDHTFYYGAPHLFYGIFYSMIPESMGGDLKKSKKEFDKALELSKDKFLMTKVSYAEFYCKATYNKQNYEKALTEVINSDIDKYPEMRLLNTFAVKQAEKLLKQIDDFFYDDDF